MKNTLDGKVLQLFLTKDNEQKNRVSQESVIVDTQGIKGDKFYAKNEQRAILITSLQSYKMAQENGIELNTGTLGENILIDINPYHLISGQTLTIGNTIFEITQNCTLCKGLTNIHSKLPKLLKDDRGIFVKAITDCATIKVGDTVSI